MPKMTGAQYAKKVEDYLHNHLDDLVIQRLRTNQPLTATDLEGLEATLAGAFHQETRGHGPVRRPCSVFQVPRRPQPHPAADLGLAGNLLAFPAFFI